MTRARLWAIGIAAGLALLCAAVYFFDWNLARPYIARQVTAATGRSFAIGGDLEVHLSLRPRVIVNGVTMGNAPWSKEPLMLRLSRANFTVDILQLLVGRLAFPEVALSGPRVSLEVNADGTPNWVFGNRDTQTEFPGVAALAIDRGSLHFRDPVIDTDLAFDISTLAAAGDRSAAVQLIGKGRFKGQPASLQARGGAVLALRNTERPYPIEAAASIGTTKASFNGTLVDPLHLRGEEINFQLEGRDLAQLYHIIDVPIPPTPAFKLAGSLSHTGHLWRFSGLKGTVGSSDVAGEFSVDHGKSPQFIAANLVSRKLDLKDLGGFIGIDPGTATGGHASPGGKFFPSRPFNIEKLRAADFDIHLKGARVITQSIPIENMDAHLVVRDGALKLAPLNFGVAGGNLVTQITMDTRNPRLATHADIIAQGLHLNELLPDWKFDTASVGTMGGRARLDGGGNSVAQMLGSANGEAALIVDGGTISELLLRKSNLDVANSLKLMLGGDKQIPIRCMVADFKAAGGEFKVQDLMLDTAKVNVTGVGSVNLADESLHLRLISKSKGFSLVSLRGPIAITGPINDPAVHAELTSAVARGGLAVALGAVTGGIGTLIPLLDLGHRETSNCADLMSEAEADAGIKPGDLAPRRPASRHAN
jgi:AsmA family protein